MILKGYLANHIVVRGLNAEPVKLGSLATRNLGTNKLVSRGFSGSITPPVDDSTSLFSLGLIEDEYKRYSKVPIERKNQSINPWIVGIKKFDFQKIIDIVATNKFKNTCDLNIFGSKAIPVECQYDLNAILKNIKEFNIDLKGIKEYLNNEKQINVIGNKNFYYENNIDILGAKRIAFNSSIDIIGKKDLRAILFALGLLDE